MPAAVPPPSDAAEPSSLLSIVDRTAYDRLINSIAEELPEATGQKFKGTCILAGGVCVLWCVRWLRVDLVDSMHAEFHSIRSVSPPQQTRPRSAPTTRGRGG